MDFMKLLRSFEEFLFEGVTWLVFYPLTVWRIVSRPLTTMAYSDAEQAEDDEHRYDDALSPPLLLLLTVVIVNLIGTAIHPNQPHAQSQLSHAVMATPQNLALFRALIFSLLPLEAAATLLRKQKIPFSRKAVRAPFYAQCYLATPCAIVSGLGVALAQRADVPHALSFGLMAVGAIWFGVTQTRWYAQRLAVSYPYAAAITLAAVARATVYLLIVVIPVALL